MRPRVSIVIPTRNRTRLVRRTIRSLARQTYPPEKTEVIVVADGCDETIAQISIEPPLSGQVLSQPRTGPAAARNRGALAAGGDLVLFLDDDVDADPGLVEAHVRAHETLAGDGIVVGFLPPALDTRRDLFGITLRSWWDAIFERMREPGHRFSYRDVLSGNCSMPKALFHQLGGFDERLWCHEDYELGYRALRLGGRIAFAADAKGRHQERTDLSGALARKRAEGAADISLVRMHPELWPSLPCAAERTTWSRPMRLLRTLALRTPLLGDRVAAAGRVWVALLARAGARQRWRTLLDLLLWYWYWRGVGEALGTTPFEAFSDESTTTPGSMRVADVDLRQGLAAAAREIDLTGPDAVTLRYGTIEIGVIAFQPWAEPLLGRHLRPLLETRFSKALADAFETSDTLDALTPATVTRVRVIEPDITRV